MSGASYLLFRLEPEILERLQLPPIPFPVGKDRVGEEIFSEQGVRFDLLLEEIDRFVREHPETAESYRPILARLAYVLAIREGSLGRPETAVGLLALGLRHDPGDYSLRVNHAFGLHMAGRLEEAVAAYREVIDGQPEDADPLIRVLAARACGELGDYEAACRLLSVGTEAIAEDEGFRRLLAGLREKSEAAAVSGAVANPAVAAMKKTPPIEVVSPGAPVDAEQGAAPGFCRACGAALRSGPKFCTACGAKVERR